MASHGSIGVTWKDVGYTDLFPLAMFHELGDRGVIPHDVIRGGTKGTKCWKAKCRVQVSEREATLDYEELAAFNFAHSMDLGVMRLHFSDENRAQVVKLEWRGVGTKTFVAAEFDAYDYVSTKSDAPYSGPGKPPTDVKKRPVKERAGQQAFRQRARRAYDNRCCVSGCSVTESLDGAHIDRFNGNLASDHECNGILLRRDLHSLFDSNLMGIDPASLVVYFAPEARQWSEYAQWHGRVTLRLPKDEACKPSDAALSRRWKTFIKAHGTLDA